MAEVSLLGRARAFAQLLPDWTIEADRPVGVNRRKFALQK
jgi:hypothetical protein